jgi:hypothetical protein
MSRELDLLAKQFSKTPVTIVRKDLYLYEKNLITELVSFIREIERIAKKDKKNSITVIAILKN